MTTRKAGRPVTIDEYKKGKALFLSCLLMNSEVAKEMGVSVATIERIRKKAGMTDKSFPQLALNLVSDRGVKRASIYLNVPVVVLELLPYLHQRQIRRNPEAFINPEEHFRTEREMRLFNLLRDARNLADAAL